jgi:putative ABC transport system permease protein
VLRDAWLHKSRTVLVVLAIAIGLTGAGAILDTWALVGTAARAGYAASRPVSATLRIEPIDAGLIAAVRALPSIEAVRARRTLQAAARANGGWQPALLFALDDFSATELGRIRGETGPWPPREGELAMEHSSLDFAGAAIGEQIELVVGRGEPHAVPVTAIARDVSLAPGWMEHVVYAFVTPATLTALGAPAGFDELQVRVRDQNADREGVRRVAREVRALAEQRGAHVSDVDVPEPGQHVHAAQMNSLLLTQAAFAILALLFCSFLVVNLVTSMLAGQVREIGIMKSVGARSAQLAAMYLSLALGLGALAALLAVPAALAIGRQYAGLKAELLNFPLDGYSVPVWAVAVQVLVACVLPVLAAAAPVRRACRSPRDRHRRHQPSAVALPQQRVSPPPAPAAHAGYARGRRSDLSRCGESARRRARVGGRPVLESALRPGVALERAAGAGKDRSRGCRDLGFGACGSLDRCACGVERCRRHTGRIVPDRRAAGRFEAVRAAPGRRPLALGS